jgi:hypothetical protein
MALDRLYRENITFLLCEPEAFVDRTAPTAAELNGGTVGWWAWGTGTSRNSLVHNITCALNEDGTEFTLGDSDTDDSITFCDQANVVTPTFYNPTVSFEAFRDADKAGTGEFNEILNMISYPNAEYIAVLRVGKPSNTAFAVGDIVKMVGVRTDYGMDVGGSGENVRIMQTFLNNDFVNWNFKVVA